jgi:hypothetical protein
MATNPPNSFIKLFYDYFAIFSLLLISLGLMTVISIVVSGSREDGMAFGLMIGFLVALAAFYYFRGGFNKTWTFVQIGGNALLTIGEVAILTLFLLSYQVDAISSQYLAIVIVFPGLIVMNKLILDYLVSLMGGEERIS